MSNAAPACSIKGTVPDRSIAGCMDDAEVHRYNASADIGMVLADIGMVLTDIGTVSGHSPNEWTHSGSASPYIPNATAALRPATNPKAPEA